MNKKNNVCLGLVDNFDGDKEDDDNEESESIKKLRKWFETYECEDTDEVIARRRETSPLKHLSNEELRKEMIDFFNKYRKEQGLPLLDADGNEICEK